MSEVKRNELAMQACSECGSSPYYPYDAPCLLRCSNWTCEHHQVKNCKPLDEWNKFHYKRKTLMLEKNMSGQCYPSIRSETGLCDSNGNMICVGDKVRTAVTNNKKFHGDWAIYEVITRGMVPVLIYVTSEKGDMLPRGYMGCALSEKYDQAMFLWATNLDDVTPVEDLFLVEGEQ